MNWMNKLKKLRNKSKFERMLGVAEVFTGISQERFGVTHSRRHGRGGIHEGRVRYRVQSGGFYLAVT